MSKKQAKTTFFFRIEIFLRRIKNDLVSDILLQFKWRLTSIIKLQFKSSTCVSCCNKNHWLSQRKEADNNCLYPTLPFVIQLLGAVIFCPLQNPIKNIICSPE
jgi:hypothetical protein